MNKNRIFSSEGVRNTIEKKQFLKIKLSNVGEKKYLKVYYTNCRSVRNKMDLLKGISCVEKPDIIALTETWLNSAGRDFKTEFEIEGYNVFNKDREGRNGGGVAIFVRDSLSSYVNTKIRSDDGNETLWVEIINGRDKLLLGCIYRPPDLSRHKSALILNELSEAAKYKNVVIMGDFNYRDIDWDNNVGGSIDSEEFVNVVSDSFLKQLVNHPTRELNVLDLLFTTNETLVSNLEVGGRLGNSDHEEIRYNINWETRQSNENKVMMPDFRKANYPQLKRHLRDYLNVGIRGESGVKPGQVGGVKGLGGENGQFPNETADSQVGSGHEVMGSGHEGQGKLVINYERTSQQEGESDQGNLEISNFVIDMPSVEEDYGNFIQILSSGQNRYIPNRKIRPSFNNNPRWMTTRLKHLIGVKREVYKKMRNGEVELRNRYNTLARLVKSLTRKAKRQYELKVATNVKSNPKGFFQLYKTKTRDRIGPLKEGEALLESSKDMSEALNQYFVSVFTQEDVDLIPEADSVYTGESSNKLINIKISRDDVLGEINKLSATKSPGPDEVYPKLIKECKDIISLTLTDIFNKSLDTGEVPTLWKQANVVPIFKKGDKSQMSNYRPISLTSVIGKMLESIIARVIRGHLDLHDLINDSQHGFTKGKSCLTNLLSFYKTVYQAADSDSNYDVIYLDFSKAFDRVPHERLLRKIKAHGIEGKVYNWIKAWLSNRKQRVVINGEKSGWGDVISGVPQGSVLGPLLFIMYINDLDNGVNSDISKFADDTKIGRLINLQNDIDQLQRDLDTMHEWAIKWQMAFNADKCSILHVGRNNEANDYTLNGIGLRKIASEKDLGVIVSDDLRPRKQCISARNRANRVLGFIARSVTNKTAEVILRLYLTLVRPHLDYAVQFWSPYYRMDINRLESIQRRMTKMIYNFRSLSYEERLKRLGLHSLERRRIRGDLIEVYKWIKGFNKGDISKVLIVSDQGRTRSNGYKLDKFRFNREIGRNWFTNRVVDEWNGLSGHVVGAESISSFKRRLDKFMDEDGRWW